MTAPLRAVTTAWAPATLVAIEARTPRVKSFFLDAPLASHVAGQHVDVRLTAPDGYTAQRAYSIASAPADRIELAIEELAEGEVSTFFHEVAQVGDTFELRGPLGGHFVWHAGDGGPLLLVGGGSGVAPLMSMLRERMRSAPEVPVLLVYSARTWDEVIFRDELVRLHASSAAFELVLVTTRGPARRDGDLERRLDAARMSTLLARWGHIPRHAYVCGADAFVGTVTAALVDAGVPARDIRAERYGGPSR